MGASSPFRVTAHARPAVAEMGFLQPLFERLAAAHGPLPERLPFVTLSYAQSIDGSIAARPAHRVTLSSERSFFMTHVLRARHCGLLVGINTVLADDPRLTVRLCEGDNPQPVVLDSRLRMPEQAQLLSHPDRHPLLLTTAQAPADRIARLQARGASVRILPSDAAGRVELRAALQCLAAEGLGCLMVEGGATVIESFLRKGLVDYCVITVAPKLMFGGLKAMDRDSASGLPPLAIAECGYQPLGGDLVIYGQPGGG